AVLWLSVGIRATRSTVPLLRRPAVGRVLEGVIAVMLISFGLRLAFEGRRYPWGRAMTARQRHPEQGRSNDEQDTAIREAATFAIAPPVEPMLAKLIEELPTGGGWLYEPKWDGFRAIVFRGNSAVFIQSRDLRPLDRYFPEL